jgi:hypothetical protein
MKTRHQIIKIIEGQAEVRGIKPSTVARALNGNSRAFEQLKAGTMTVANFEKLYKHLTGREI